MKNLDMYFDIPTEKCIVIKNGVMPIVPRTRHVKGDPIKLNISSNSMERFKCNSSCNAAC
jgi:hypothetical protein